jgi:hypothetical protein
MPRAQKKRARRGAEEPARPDSTSVSTPDEPAADAPRPGLRGLLAGRVRREREIIEPAEGFTEPPPWSRQGLLTLALLVAVLQLPLAFIDYFRDSRAYPFGSYLVVTLYPSLLPLPLLASFLLAMPVARRLAGEERRMRVLETLAVAAVVLILLIGFWTMVINASGHGLDGYDRAQMAGIGAADVAALVLGSLAFPLIYRRFWMPRRRMRGPR